MSTCLILDVILAAMISAHVVLKELETLSFYTPCQNSSHNLYSSKSSVSFLKFDYTSKSVLCFLQVELSSLEPLSFVSFPNPTVHLLMPLYGRKLMYDCRAYAACILRVGQNHIYMYSIFTVFLAGGSPNIQYTVIYGVSYSIYGFGQPYVYYYTIK